MWWGSVSSVTTTVKFSGLSQRCVLHVTVDAV